jgi:Putative Flp pilus-assembly TadE/G-like
MLAMPLFLALISLVADGGNILVHKRNVQVAADAAALAIAQNVDLASPSCDDACADVGREYAKKNGIDVDSSWHKCDAAHTTNCWTYPYNGHNDRVEVRLKAHVTTFIAGVIGLYGANVSARAVASTAPITGTSTSPDVSVPPSTTVSTTPGGTHTTTDPDQLSGDSGVAFTMSRLCGAFTYGGNPKGEVTGAFATNGGLTFNGFGNPKKVAWLAYDASRCPKPTPDSGTSNCTAKAWGDSSDSNNLCVKTLVSLNAPVNWPISPPNPPTPRSGTWNASADFGRNCIDLGSGNVTFSTSGNPPGVYCVSGATARLTINNVGDLTAGDGYTFFALGGATINVSGNTNKLRFYWPSGPAPTGCGARPTTRTQTFTCFGRTISGYDPQTLLYATYPSPDGTTCAICLDGSSNDLTGDIFAPKPDTFPPTLPPQTGGGLVAIQGGGLASGSGFIESWLLSLSGNTGSYRGTGASIVIPGQTHTTTDPDTTTTVVISGTIIAGTTQVTTIGTAMNLNE